MIAFDLNTKLIYEGESHYGHGLWPAPMVTIATCIADSNSYQQIPRSDDLARAKLLFREDSFDPVTRIRRGRFYSNPGTQPCLWHVHPHSFLPNQSLTDMQLYTFQRWREAREVGVGKHAGLMALGIADAYTLWRVIDVERISTGDDLVTLRARTTLGLLPELMIDVIPEAYRTHVVNATEKVAEAAFRAGPASVIDRCRDAAQVCIGVWFGSKTKNDDVRALDLSPLLEKIEKEHAGSPPSVLINAGRIIARLHARKPNEQIKRGARENVEGDAEVALANFGLVLRELEWTLD